MQHFCTANHKNLYQILFLSKIRIKFFFSQNPDFVLGLRGAIRANPLKLCPDCRTPVQLDECLGYEALQKHLAEKKKPVEEKFQNLIPQSSKSCQILVSSKILIPY